MRILLVRQSSRIGRNENPVSRDREVTLKSRILVVAALLPLVFTSTASGQSGNQQRSLEDALTRPVAGGSPLLGDKPVTPVGAPAEAFKGCAPPKNLDGGTINNAERIRARQATVTDPVTARRFAAVEIDPNEAVTDEGLANDCRLRLDGVWIQDAPVVFDRTSTPKLFSGLPNQGFKPELTHGNYTTPLILHVKASDDGQTLAVRSAMHDDEPNILRSTDGISLLRLFTPGGPVKTYNSGGGAPMVFEASTDRFGRIRLRFVSINFRRPQPTVTEAQDTSAADVFAVGFNLDNLTANRRGYDIVTMNMFNLLADERAEVFAAANPQDYYISEKRTVPLGLKLHPENYSGTVASSTMTSSQREYQQVVSTSIGVNIGFKTLGDDGKALEDLGSASAGANYATERTTGAKYGTAQMRDIGFARHKLYSLTLDRPFATLSKDFIAAIDDAMRLGRYDELIRKFGTHYPYAITYGSAARMETGFDSETINEWQANGENVSTKSGFSLVGFGVSSQSNVYTENRKSIEEFNQASFKDFSAVGGTGSFGEGGHQTGTPSPILADLRPLYELLSPLYFPNEPRIYTTARSELKVATEAYLREHANKTSTARYEPEIQTWRIHSRWLRCTFAGDDIISINPIGRSPIPKAQLRGWIKLQSIQQPAGHEQTNAVYPFHAINGVTREIGCMNDNRVQHNIRKMRPHNDYLIVRGTVAEIRKYVFRYRAEIAEVDGGLNPDDTINANSPNLLIPARADSKVGDYYTREWDLPHPSGKHARLHVNTRIERVK
ncbi:MAC/perforin domain-containing protein [Pontixanthobacter aquaemixtae]|uniref:MACPF domain-containing protein n=1 Tax=Pontixanthobacter aquaemixtae TaxID=1958940 RepID=A0A844ZQH7_9SPHN|nr:MAC/perforin domain-containing protein [Pontixanthobacter aquaemixtae]MXO89286.1 hypothetical protein [Pontixanthobacter aquaemixtae]